MAAARDRHDFFNLADIGRELDSPNNTQNDRRRRHTHDSSSDDSDDDAIFSRPAARVVTIQPSSRRLKPYVVEESSARCRAKNRAGRAALLTALKEVRVAALAKHGEQLAGLEERLEGLSKASGPKKRGRLVRLNWQTARRAEMKAVQAEIDEIRYAILQ
jgi:hypothetical protein